MNSTILCTYMATADAHMLHVEANSLILNMLVLKPRKAKFIPLSVSISITPAASVN